MKKLIVGPYPPPAGGVATWTLEYISYFRALGEEILLVDTSLTGRRAQSFGKKRSLVAEARRCFRIWSSLGKCLRKARPELVNMNVNCSPAGTIRDLISAIIVRNRKTPLILHCHCNIEDQIGSGRLANRALKTLLGIADGIIVLNSKSYSYVSRTVEVKTAIIPNFIKEAVDTPKPVSDDVNAVLFAGHVSKAKGIDEILELAGLKKNVRFILAGPVAEEYREIYDKGGLENVVFTGELSHENTLELMRKSDVFLFPSYTEGFSMALLEAMAAGLPCIATDDGANADMLEGKGGIVVKSKDANELKTALDSIEAKDIRQAMSAWNVEKVKSAYTIEAVVKQLNLFYSEVVK